jgi:hypothetical protein
MRGFSFVCHSAPYLHLQEFLIDGPLSRLGPEKVSHAHSGVLPFLREHMQIHVKGKARVRVPYPVSNRAWV